MLLEATVVLALVPSVTGVRFEDPSRGLTLNVALPGARTCWVKPPAQTADPECGSVPADIGFPGDPSKLLFAGVFRSESGDVIFYMAEHRLDHAHRMPAESLEPTLESIATGASDSFGEPVDVYGTFQKSPAHILRVSGVPVVSYTLAPRGMDVRLLNYAVVGVDRWTVLTLSAPTPREKEIRDAAGTMIGTLVAPRESLEDFGKPRAYLRGKAIGELAAAPCMGLALAAVVFVVQRLRGGRTPKAPSPPVAPQSGSGVSSP